MRGVRQPGVKTITTRFTGALETGRQLPRPLPADGARDPHLTGLPSARSSGRPSHGCRPLPRSFAARGTPAEVESGLAFSPKFDADGLIPAIVTDAASGEVLMFAWMNAEALAAHARDAHRPFLEPLAGASSGRRARRAATCCAVSEVRTDCDQDVIWLKVAVAGDGVACHTGERSCFYRSLPLGARPSPDRPMRRA